MPALHELTPALAASLGVITPRHAGANQSADHVVLVLVDGLGWLALNEHRELVPHLCLDNTSAWFADMPTTTPTGLGSIGTGLPVGEHGFVGASFFLPETQEILAPLRWAEGVSPIMVQPEMTMFEYMARDGIRVSSIGPPAYEESGLTRAALRGANYLSAISIEQYGDALAMAQADTSRSFTYVYWPHLDRVGHGYGVKSAAWRSALIEVDALIATMMRVSLNDTQVVVTADHGMVDVTDADRIQIEQLRSFRGVDMVIAGEPRFRHIFVQGDKDGIAERLQQEIGHACDVFTREDVLRERILGPLDPHMAERVGDIVCRSRDRWLLTSLVDQRVSALRGQHGSSTPEEQLIPAVFMRA